jgi:hypothetical protein
MVTHPQAAQQLVQHIICRYAYIIVKSIKKNLQIRMVDFHVNEFKRKPNFFQRLNTGICGQTKIWSNCQMLYLALPSVASPAI